MLGGLVVLSMAVVKTGGNFLRGGLAAVLMPAGQYSWKYPVRLFGIAGEQETPADY